MKAYCERHGYHFYADVSTKRDTWVNPLSRQRETLDIIGFSKMDLFLYLLPKYARCVWLDADLLITNPALSIDELTFGSTAELILPYDFNAHNATVIIAQSTERVFDFMWAVNNTGRKLYLGHDWREMEAMRYFLQTPPYAEMETYISAKRLCPILHEHYIDAGVPAKVSEKYGWEDGDFALHLSALHIDQRVAIAREYAEIYCK